jgi:predicted metal-dependent phosphotriesterase family hydrolase
MDHPLALIPYPKEDLLYFTRKGVYLDLPYIMMSGWKFVTSTPDAHESYYSPARYAEMIKTVGAEQCIMSTDFGQVHNPPPPEGLRIFIRAMRENGVSDGEIRMMVSENPAKMLGI